MTACCRVVLALAVFLAAQTVAAQSPTVQSGHVRIELELSCAEAGTLHVFVCDQTNFGAPEAFLLHREVIVSDPALPVLMVFEDLPPDDYAFRAFVDQNGNGRLDRGLFGPSEPWALSWNDERLMAFPSWQQVSHSLSAGTHHFSLEVTNYWKTYLAVQLKTAGQRKFRRTYSENRGSRGADGADGRYASGQTHR